MPQVAEGNVLLGTVSLIGSMSYYSLILEGKAGSRSSPSFLFFRLHAETPVSGLYRFHNFSGGCLEVFGVFRQIKPFPQDRMADHILEVFHDRVMEFVIGGDQYTVPWFCP